MGKNVSICHPVYLKMQLLRLIAHLPWSLDYMLSKSDAFKTAQTSAIFEGGWIYTTTAGRNVSATLLQKQHIVFTFPHCGRKLLNPVHSYSGAFKRIHTEDTTRLRNVSVPYFSLAARCGTSAVPEGSLTTAQGLHCPLQTPSWTHTAPKEQICWGFIEKIFQPQVALYMPGVTCRKGSCDGCLALPFRARQRGPWVTALLLPEPEFNMRSSTGEQHTPADATQITSHFCGLALLMTVRGCGGSGEVAQISSQAPAVECGQCRLGTHVHCRSVTVQVSLKTTTCPLPGSVVPATQIYQHFPFSLLHQCCRMDRP